MESENPMDRVLFYKKENKDEAFLILREEVTTDIYTIGHLSKYNETRGCSDNWTVCISETILFVRLQADYLVHILQVSPMLPETFLERHIRVYVKEQKHETAAKEWVYIIFILPSTR